MEQELPNELKERIPKFPHKKIMNMRDDVTQKRCRKLQDYLNKLIEIPQISEIKQFLNFLSTSVTAKGEEFDDLFIGSSETQEIKQLIENKDKNPIKKRSKAASMLGVSEEIVNQTSSKPNLPISSQIVSKNDFDDSFPPESQICMNISVASDSGSSEKVAESIPKSETLKEKSKKEETNKEETDPLRHILSEHHLQASLLYDWNPEEHEGVDSTLACKEFELVTVIEDLAEWSLIEKDGNKGYVPSNYLHFED